MSLFFVSLVSCFICLWLFRCVSFVVCVVYMFCKLYSQQRHDINDKLSKQPHNDISEASDEIETPPTNQTSDFLEVSLFVSFCFVCFVLCVILYVICRYLLYFTCVIYVTYVVCVVMLFVSLCCLCRCLQTT